MWRFVRQTEVKFLYRRLFGPASVSSETTLRSNVIPSFTCSVSQTVVSHQPWNRRPSNRQLRTSIVSSPLTLPLSVQPCLNILLGCLPSDIDSEACVALPMVLRSSGYPCSAIGFPQHRQQYAHLGKCYQALFVLACSVFIVMVKVGMICQDSPIDVGRICT